MMLALFRWVSLTICLAAPAIQDRIAGGKRALLHLPTYTVR
jgi:hypothetical protein